MTELEFVPEGKPHALSVSVGGAAFRFKTTFADLYRRADKRLYEAKRNGRNQLEFDLSLYERPPAALAS